MMPVQGWVVEVAPLDVPAHQVTQGEEELGDGRRLDGLPHVHTSTHMPKQAAATAVWTQSSRKGVDRTAAEVTGWTQVVRRRS